MRGPLLASALLFAGLISPLGCAGQHDDDAPGEDESRLDEAALAGAPAATKGIEFPRACEPGDRITVAAMGDVLPHAPLQRQAYASPEGFTSLWKSVRPLMEGADLAYANLEGAVAPGITKSGKEVPDPGKVYDGNVYSDYPDFNYHPSIITDLKASGIDVVSTANNHALDRGALGADRTIDELRAAGLPYTGTRRQSPKDEPWYTITEAKNMRVAWLACTFLVNVAHPDTKKQVLNCFRDTPEIVRTIGELKSRADIDAVMITPHWGKENTHVPVSEAGDPIPLAKKLLDAGATAVLGGHPHVLQPWERYTTRDGRETFLIYSLGNFVSGQGRFAQKTTIMLFLGLTKKPGEKAFINGVRYAPLFMGNESGTLGVRSATSTADAMKLTTHLYGDWNRSEATWPVTTNPSCAR